MSLKNLSPKAKRFLPLSFALAFGVLAVVFGQRYMSEQVAAQRKALEQEKQRILTEYPPPIDVVVASKDIPINTAIEASQLQISSVPEKFVQPYAARSINELLGMVTVVPIASGEQVLLNKVHKADEVPSGTTLSNIVPKGKRAVTIEVDTITGVGGMVRPGDIVDILWTISLPAAGGGQGQFITMTLFQDVPVMAVERELPGRKRAAGGQEGEAPAQPEGVKEYTVTLALAPQEVSFLLFAREQGKIQLSLRPLNEKGSQMALTPVNMNTLLGAMVSSEALQGDQATSRREIELYKGLSRDVVVVPGHVQPQAQAQPDQAKVVFPTEQSNAPIAKDSSKEAAIERALTPEANSSVLEKTAPEELNEPENTESSDEIRPANRGE